MDAATPGDSGTKIRELEDLLQQSLSPEQFYQGYLAALTKLTGLRGGHLWMLQGSEFADLGGSPLAETLYDTNPDQRGFILGQIRLSASRQESLVTDPGSAESAENRCPLRLVFTPLLMGRGGGAVQGVQMTWWTPGTTINGQDNPVPILEACGAYAARIMRAQKLESMSQMSDQLRQMTLFLAELGSATDTPALAVATANRGREITGCDRAALLVAEPDGALRLAAISNVPTPDPRSAVGRTLLQLGDNARHSGLPAIFRKANEKTEEKGDLSDYFYHSDMEEAMVLAIQPAGHPLCGLLICESRRSGHFSPARQQPAMAVAAQASGPLAAALSAEQMPFRKTWQKLADWRRLPPGEKRRRLTRRLWIPAAAALGLALFPWKFEITGDARIMPRQRAMAVAEVAGRIVHIEAKAGAPVRAGDLLATIDGAEQRKLLDIAVQEEMRLQAEADRLMSLNERAAAQVASLELERARRERQYHEDALAKAAIRSPIDGVIMTPDLASRQGDSVAPGAQLAMVGDPSAWDLEIGLPEAEVAILLRRLHDGQEIPVRYLLNSFPSKRFEATVQGTGAVAAAAEVQSGRNLFRVTVPLPEEPAFATLFRAGYTGRARLLIGHRPVAYVATRRFLNWIRTHVLF